MTISKRLQSQIDRLKNTGAFSISHDEKKELRQLVDEIGGRPLTNLSCGVCVRNAMWEVSNFVFHKENIPKLQFKGVKSPKDMTYQELRQAVKDKGLLKKYMKKQEMIKALENEI